ncbi:tRNA uracil-5-methyltransferase-like protein [Euroglyphus maynei]|uniref:tRNA (uracil(54)-C(5))-methyltransferase n=1 Tax=Euroglyphus maynei TaxID=6958 RepID=A0A1Y3B3K0_EURMA|nr:tRNA uracil-5-methyltransferase-like protein [Euroglyphus maynei]
MMILSKSLKSNSLINSLADILTIQYRHRSLIRNRLKNDGRRRQPTTSTIQKSPIDDEKYHDHDFDYDDHSDQRKPTKSLKQLFKDDHNNRLFSNKDRLVSKNESFVNALYEEIDNNHQQKKSLKSNQKRNFIEKLHEKYENQQETSGNKNGRTLVPLPYDINEENRFDIINDIVMPLHKIPYGEQLKRKLYMNKDLLRSFGSKLRHVNKMIRIGNNDMPCTLESVRPSPLTERYRNKDEFSIWPGIDGNPKTVGFFVGQPSKHDRVICVEPDRLIITKQSHLDLAKKFQQYLRDVSPLDVCQNYGVGGHWRRVHIRSNRNDEHMLTAILHPQDLDENNLREEMDRIRDYFADDERISSLYFHATRHTRSTHTSERYHHLAGDQTITEQLFDKNFVISPSSFFQVNTLGAEILYRAIMTEMNLTKNTTVLDLCCGTGTLAILLSDQVKRIIAIDSSESAINDARKNAEINGAKNIEFITGTVEQELPRLISESYVKKPVVAIANPSRRALHPHVIRTLREMEFINRLVYVSCKPQGDALRNFVQLCSTTGNESSSFIPINAIPVDLFPHTEHCELIVTFERF